jgi:hypothetical protein
VLPGQRPHEHQVRHVRARDEQDQPDGAEQNQHGSAHVAHDIIPQRRDRRPHAAVAGRIRLLQALRNGVEFRPRLCHGYTRLQARHHIDFMVAMIGQQVRWIGGRLVHGDPVGHTELAR